MLFKRNTCVLNRLLVLGFILIYQPEALAQSLVNTNPAPQQNAYYQDLNVAQSNAVIVNIYNDILSLKYYDKIGEAKQLTLGIYDWRNTLVTEFNIKKSFGLNYYNINLKSIYEHWDTGHVYYCKGVNEEGKAIAVLFRFAKSKAIDSLSVDIFVNPVRLNCEQIDASSILYISKIDGGKTPYNLTWYVISNNMSDLLYQPKQEQVTALSQSSMIEVGASLDYYVMLHVEDACGARGRQVVHVQCKDDPDQFNTIFIQKPSDMAPFNNATQ